MIYKIFRTLLQLVLLVIFINPSNAEWQSLDDNAIEIKAYNLDIAIDKDGSDERSVYMHAKILKEQGRMFFANYRLPYLYRENIDTIKILKAQTILNGKKYNVSADSIEDKPLAATGLDNDIYRQISVTFPKLEIGTEIFLKYKVTSKSPLEGVYSNILGLLPYGYHKKMQININSKLPLDTKINDPYCKLRVVNASTTKINNDEHTSSVRITLLKPLTNMLKNESKDSVLNEQYNTWVSVSTISKWEKLGDNLSSDYFKVINQPLPKLFAAIAEDAKQYSNYTEQIDFVTSSFNEKIQYIPGRRSTNGKFIPRDLIKVMNFEKGDCGDFIVSIAAILKNIGYKVYPALIIRAGEIFAAPVLHLPNFYSFDYIILKVIDKNDKIYWIDPCNSLSMANGIFPNIANRMALVLDPEKSSYEQVSSIDPKHSQIIHNSTLEIEGNITNWKGEISYIGENSAILHNKLLYMSQQQIKELFFNDISGIYLEEHNKKNITLPSVNLKLPRIVKDGTIEYEYNTDCQIKKTNAGPVLFASIGYNSVFNNIISVTSKQVGDLFIGAPHTNYNNLVIKNLKLKNIDYLNYVIDTPWIYVERSCKHQGDDTEIISKIVIRQSLIPNNDLKSDVYKKLKDDIEQHFNKTAIVLVE